MRIVTLFGAVCTVLFAAMPAAGELRLAWRAPEGCPSGEEVKRAAIQAASNGDKGDDLSVDASAVVERGDVWRVHLSTRRGGVTGERHLEATTCRGLADATAVILALTLASPREVKTAPASITTTTAATASDPPIPPATAKPTTMAPTTTTAPQDAARERSGEVAASSPSRPATPRRSLAIGAAGAVQAATLPSPAVGGNLALAWTPGRARFEASASLWRAQSQNTATSAMGARFGMTTLGAAACYAVVKSSVELGPCAGGEVALLNAEGYGASENYDAGAQWGAVTLGALGRVPLGSVVALRTRLDTVIPLSRPTFVIENGGTVHQPAFFGVRASLGIEMHFL